MREFTCTVCPRGCRLRVEEDTFRVTGNSCPRGEAYGKAELTHPTRVLTSTVRAEGGLHRRLPVKSAAPIPKGLLIPAARVLDGVTVRAPIRAGQVILENILDTGADIVATRDL